MSFEDGLEKAVQAHLTERNAKVRRDTIRATAMDIIAGRFIAGEPITADRAVHIATVAYDEVMQVSIQ